MPDSLKLVHNYFDRNAADFAAIYDGRKPLYRRVMDAVFRRVVVERFAFVINSIVAPGRTVLDVGCGPGHYGIELARRGAALCEGVDVSTQMIELARSRATQTGVADRCKWKASDFLSFCTGEKFDIVLAMGYFDYINNPLPHLHKMMAIARQQVFASFPKRWTLRTLTRLLRFKLEGGYVRFYSRNDVTRVFKDAGYGDQVSVISFGRDYIAICNVATTGCRADNGQPSFCKRPG